MQISDRVLNSRFQISSRPVLGIFHGGYCEGYGRNVPHQVLSRSRRIESSRFIAVTGDVVDPVHQRVMSLLQRAPCDKFVITSALISLEKRIVAAHAARIVEFH